YRFGAAKSSRAWTSLRAAAWRQGGYGFYGDSCRLPGLPSPGGHPLSEPHRRSAPPCSITSSMNVRQHNLQEATWCWYLTPPHLEFSSFQLIYEVASAYLKPSGRRTARLRPPGSPSCCQMPATAQRPPRLISFRRSSQHPPVLGTRASGKAFVEDSAIAGQTYKIGGEMELEPETSAPLFQLRSGDCPGLLADDLRPGVSSVVEPISYGRDAAAQLQCCSTAGILF
uniref:Reelin domain-containing protein n=1 Tax=Macrostomum lignano TaxID=282301 RepID=A0A1I8FPC3_9PLAT